MNKDYYAILMYKINVDVEVVLYKAQTIIEGTLDEDDIFVSDNYDAYLDITNPSVIEESLDNAVGYVISEDDLLNKYPNFDIYKAKEMYMEDVRKYAHFGFYDYQSEAIKIVDVSLKDVLNKGVSNISNYIKECSDFYNNDKIDNYTKKIEQSFNEITNSDDAEEVYNQLENIMNIFTLLLCNLDKIDGKKIDKNKISNYLYEINDVMDAAKNMQIEEVKKSILSIEDKVINNVRKIENIERSFISNIEELEDEKISNQLKEPLNVIEAKKFMDERIIGLEEAKKVLISTFAFNRISDNSRNHCLIIGPSGSGKTFLVRVMQEYLNVPVEIVDITQVSVAGYVGANVEDSLVSLLKKAKGNQEVAENGIIVFNEIDKKGTKDNGDISGRGVLNSLLPFMEGTIYTVYYGGQKYDFDTSKLTIFATGAFSDVIEMKKKKSIGFIKNDGLTKDNNYVFVTLDDLNEHGDIPMELLGRFTHILSLPEPSIKRLKRILISSKYSPLYLKQLIFLKMNILLTCTEEFIDEVAKKAYSMKTGARSLNSIIEDTLKEVEWFLLTHPQEYKEILLTEETIVNNLICWVIDKNGNRYCLKDILNNEVLEEQNEKTLIHIKKKY